MARNPQPKIVEIHVYRSKRRPKIGHAVATLFPCNHKVYMGITRYNGAPESRHYLAQSVTIIKLEVYDVMDKSHCKSCPPSEIWIDDLPAGESQIVDTWEAIDSGD